MSGSLERALVGAGTQYVHYTDVGSNYGKPINNSGDMTIKFGPITLRSDLLLLENSNVPGTWVPRSRTETGLSSLGGGTSTYTSSLSAGGIVTTSESGSWPALGFTSVTSLARMLFSRYQIAVRACVVADQ